jgi:hypothetical protein
MLLAETIVQATKSMTSVRMAERSAYQAFTDFESGTDCLILSNIVFMQRDARNTVCEPMQIMGLGQTR